MRSTIVAALILALAGCTGNQSAPSPSEIRAAEDRARYQRNASADVQVSAPAPVVDASTAGYQPTTPSQPNASARKLIRNGEINVETPRLDDAIASVRKMVGSAGGYLAGETAAQDQNEARTATLICRVPAAQLDDFIERVRALGVVRTLSVNAEDITEQDFDLEVRLANQKRLEARLIELIGRSTNRLSDLLEIEKEAARVRTETETLEGRKRLWDSQVSLSTLTVTLHEPLPVVAGEEGGAWRTLKRSFREAADNFVMTIAGVISASGAIIPMLVVIGLGVWAIAKVWQWRRRRKVGL